MAGFQWEEVEHILCHIVGSVWGDLHNMYEGQRGTSGVMHVEGSDLLCD